jgi:CubicO group peptidase (beta-lactamase class C family)/D-alanyl-D-alanine dipeptidase
VLLAVALLAVTLLAGCAEPAVRPESVATEISPRPDYAAATAKLAAFIEHEMADKQLPALSVVLVDDQEVVWARGFGWADPADSVPATASTVYRIGSVSKLFTDLAVMQLVERGELDLDVPVTDYLPEFRPGGYDEPPTLRQLTSHRSGLVREPPVGHYFDDTEPSLAATVLSLNETERVYEPETETKYSNAGIAVVGYVLEERSGEPFAEYLRRAVLEPLGMDHSSFKPRSDVVGDLARATMWSYDGRTFEAPTFELGMAPAGSMYAPVTDLGRFLKALFAGGRGERGELVSERTLAAMLTPQFAPPDAETGYGIGFSIGKLDGHRYAGHGGAVYGFATQLGFLPDLALGAAAVATMDVANTVTDRITDYALRLMLAARAGEPLPNASMTGRVPPDLAGTLHGRWVAADGFELRVEDRGASRGDGELYTILGGRRYRLRARSDTLIIDDRHGWGGYLRYVDGVLVARDGTRLERAGESPPQLAPRRWLGLIGEYGWDHNTLFIYEDGGRLHALIEWIHMDRLEEVAPDTFAFPGASLYHGERLVFRGGEDGRADGVVAAGIQFPRRNVGTPAGETYRITPVRPVEELRADALASTPPAESGEFRTPDLVELRALDPTIRYDIRYATTNNFMGATFYRSPHAYLQRPAAEALVRVHRALRDRGYGLMIHDAYRPWFVTKMFWDATPAAHKVFVADPEKGSRHNRGGAVDLTLYRLATGEPVDMVGGYDEFSERSYPDYVGGTSLQRWHRELLRRAMEAEGFRVYDFEWWHFDYEDWAHYPILNRTFEQLADPGGADRPGGRR